MDFVKMPYSAPIAASQQFPVEFPKWVHPQHGAPILVNSAEEESMIMAGAAPRRLEADRPSLVKQAENLGIKIDRRWGEDRLRVAIEMAQAGQSGDS